MKAVHGRSLGTAAGAARASGLFRRRLMSRSDVKRAQRAGRSHNRQPMREAAALPRLRSAHSHSLRRGRTTASPAARADVRGGRA